MTLHKKLYFRPHKITRDSLNYIKNHTKLQFRAHKTKIQGSETYITQLQNYLTKLTTLHYRVHKCKLRYSQNYIIKHTKIHDRDNKITLPGPSN
jgi:hypothetical protein